MKVNQSRSVILGWLTDLVSIDYPIDDNVNIQPHTILLFIPGNPGVIHWYTDFLLDILRRLGPGFTVRGVSYAGHGFGEQMVGTDEDHYNGKMFAGKNNSVKSDENSELSERQNGVKDMRISWTMEGQIEHKLEWIDYILYEWREKSSPFSSDLSTIQKSYTPKLVFLSHSIGSHLVQCMLLRRPDLLAQTQHIIHLMPFIRFDPPMMKKILLSNLAKYNQYSVPILTEVSRGMTSMLPRRFIDVCMEKIAGVKCVKGRSIAVDVFRENNMVRNHLILGTQEIREIPEFPNDVALRIIGELCSISILFCGGPDQWAPQSHMKDLECLQASFKIPDNIHCTYLQELRHDFIVQPEMILPVVNFCVDIIIKKSSHPCRNTHEVRLQSKL